MVRYRVLIVDDDEQLLASMIQLFEMNPSVKTVGAVSFAEVQDKRASALQCNLAILDINLGPNVPSGLDVFKWLCNEQFQGTVAFLTGHAKSHPMVAQAMKLHGTLVYEKPMEVGHLLKVVLESTKPLAKLS